MLIHELKKSSWLQARTQRVWRWNSCKRWNYCWRGMGWQKSRSGGNIPAFFEGWQTALHMRLPKLRGFKRYFKLIDTFEVVNLWPLSTDERVFDKKIDKTLLAMLWYISKDTVLVKVLWKGDCIKPLSFVGLDKISHSAKLSLEKAGWSFSHE